MIAVAWRVAGLLWSAGVLLTVGALLAGAATDRREQRAADRQRRAADVALARARQVPARLVAHDDVSLTPDESYQWVVISDGFGPRGSAA